MNETVDGRKARRIVLIEDNADAAESLKLLLELNGHQVIVADDGASGLHATREARPDLVLCDIGLPGELDGYDVARAIKKDDELESVRLVAVTGYGQEEDTRRAREAGFDEHLVKPVDVQDIEKLCSDL